MTLSDMSNDLPPYPNVVIKLSLCLYLYHVIDDEENRYLYQILFDYTCMLRIGCKPVMLITLTSLKLA
jgi:hypothetical protein